MGTGLSERTESSPPRDLTGLREELRRRTERWLATLRLGIGTALVVMAAAAGYGAGVPRFREVLPLLALYLCAAGGLGVLARRARFAVLAQALPFLDVLVIFALRGRSLPASDFPTGAAGWTLGLFLFVQLLASLSARPLALVATAALAFACEAALQRQAGVGPGAIAASGGLLAATAAVALYASKRTEWLVQRLVGKEVERSLATERSAAAERSRAQLAEHLAALEAAQTEAQSLTSFLVHDMKGPLTGLKAMTELARETLPPDAEAREYLDQASDMTRRLVGMMGDLLTISRLERAGSAIKPRGVQTRALLEGVRATLAGQAHQIGASLELRLEHDGEVFLDGDLVQRMLENLAGNALRYVRAGDRIEVCLRRDGMLLWLVVRNSGPPVPEEVRGHLFEKNHGSRDSHHNVGLGLYFCRMVAEAHGGSIALVADQAPWNVRFEACIPLARAKYSSDPGARAQAA
jgi:two-component system, OmpR family, heavy metal sensor histidine kinase CusS